jgi:hydroxyacylglutathione hydrolase
MRQIRPDLWETAPDSPFEGLTTHAYLWTPPDRGNALFYNTAGDQDLD